LKAEKSWGYVLGQELNRLIKMGVLFIIVVIYVTYIFISSPFLFVYGDDRVIHYTGADVDIGDAEDAQAME